MRKKKRNKQTGTRIKTFTLNKLLTRLPVLLAQTKAENNSYKLKNKIRQVVYLLHEHNKITKKLHSNLINSLKQWVIIKDSKLFITAKPETIHFDLPKDLNSTRANNKEQD